MSKLTTLAPADRLTPAPQSPVVGLVAAGITKSYRRGIWPRRRVVPVLRGADLTVGAAEVVGLTGENGSGKSTLMKILVSALQADAGRVDVSGRIGYCPQEPVLYDRLTCDEHLELFGVAYGMNAAAVAFAAAGLYSTLGFDRRRGAGSTSSRAAPGRSSTWPLPCSPTRTCCSSTQLRRRSPGRGGHGRMGHRGAGWARRVLPGVRLGTADRRLAAAGRRTAPVVTGRIGTCLGLAVVASAGGLAALAARSGLNDPGRAVAATLLVGVIYMALGVLVGTFVRSDMNGSLLITLFWILGVFLGPALSSGSSAVTWAFPLHFPTLVLTSQAGGHAGPLGDVGWSILWAVGLTALAVARMAITTRPTSLPTAAALAASGVVAVPAPGIASNVAPPPRRPAVAAVATAATVTGSTAPSAAGTAPVTARLLAAPGGDAGVPP